MLLPFFLFHFTVVLAATQNLTPRQACTACNDHLVAVVNDCNKCADDCSLCFSPCQNASAWDEIVSCLNCEYAENMAADGLTSLLFYLQSNCERNGTTASGSVAVAFPTTATLEGTPLNSDLSTLTLNSAPPAVATITTSIQEMATSVAAGVSGASETLSGKPSATSYVDTAHEGGGNAVGNAVSTQRSAQATPSSSALKVSLGWTFGLVGLAGFV